MYEEKIHFHNRYTKGLQWLCASLAAIQLAGLVAAEAGVVALPFGVAAHWGILLCTATVFGLASQVALELRIGAGGMSLRFFPWQWRWTRVWWSEIRRIRLLPSDEKPKGASFGFPKHDFAHACWLTRPSHRVLNLTLVNGTQLYVSTKRPVELLDFLQRRVAIVEELKG